MLPQAVGICLQMTWPTRVAFIYHRLRAISRCTGPCLDSSAQTTLYFRSALEPFRYLLDGESPLASDLQQRIRNRPIIELPLACPLQRISRILTNRSRTSHDSTITMLALLALLGYLAAFSSATALTYKLSPNEKECFYTQVDKAGAKIAFYFAVQSGGSFDVAYSVHGPSKEHGKDRVILEGEKERQGDFVFTANQLGEYRFCFDNSLSTFSDKTVDFEITVEDEVRGDLPQKAGVPTDQLGTLEESVMRLSSQISTLTRQQKYFRTRENRNFSTVRSTEKRIFNFSLIESGLMVAMAGLQVFIVKMFFTGGRKGYV
nr:putative membrane protein c17a5.08 [Quercus suber]